MTAIGIDVGTCFTRAGVMNLDSFQVIDSSASRQTLNYVSIKSNGREIGEHLRAKIWSNYKKIIYDSKSKYVFLFIMRYRQKIFRFGLFYFLSLFRILKFYKFNELTYYLQEKNTK